MTSSETKPLGVQPPKIQRGVRIDQVVRKPSFKCPVSNRPAPNQRITRKVLLPMSTVQALTCKFNELSQSSQTQIKSGMKGKKGQALVKRGVNGKSSTITVVICRKPSTLKQRKQEERKPKLPEEKILEASVTKNVQQRVNEFEGRKNASKQAEKIITKTNIKRTSKIVVPKVIVDIDLSDDKCLNNSEVPKSTSETMVTNGWSVKSAIDRFEKNLGTIKTPLSALNQNNKMKDWRKGEEGSVDENENTQIKNENIAVNKLRPIATIKPILKKTEDKLYPISSLSPKDSLYRKKYLGMKRDQIKGNKENDQDPGKSVDKKANTKEIVEPKGYYQSRQIESLERLKNVSSLFGSISQANASLEPKESDIKVQLTIEEDTKTVNLKPNTSFLWSRKEEPSIEVTGEKVNRSDMPLPLPPENYIPDISEEKCYPETIYDDVQPKDPEEFDKASNHSDETVYDDIGVYNKCTERYEKINEDNEGNERTTEEVRKKNFLNSMVNGEVSDSLYCISENLVYNYDDGESERYHYIRHRNSENGREGSVNEPYQYIQNEDEGNNIYEDIQSVKNRLLTKEDVNGDENASVVDCYESVYVTYANTEPNRSFIRSSSSDASNNSCRSTYEKSNSLYGLTTGNSVNSDRSSKLILRLFVYF